MSEVALGIKRCVVSLAARVTYHSGMIRGLGFVANRFERTPSRNDSAGFPYIRRRRSRNVQILVYHRVTVHADEYLPSLPLDGFTRQMEYLARRCHVLSLSEALDAMASSSVPDNAVVITFDDGYRDNYIHAYPILRALALPATVFLSAGVVGTHDILWHDRVFRAFHRTQMPWFDRCDLTDSEQKGAARDGVLAALKVLDSQARTRRINDLVRQLEVEEPELQSPLMLSWREAREMAQGGISFGSHTLTHPTLSRIPVLEARREVAESKRMIESNLETRIDTFAYPNGRATDYNESIKQLLREAGYTSAVTTKFGTNGIDEEGRWDPLELRRGGPADSSPALFAAKLCLYKFAS